MQAVRGRGHTRAGCPRTPGKPWTGRYRADTAVPRARADGPGGLPRAARCPVRSEVAASRRYGTTTDYVTSTQIYDSLGQARQSQTAAEGWNTTVSMTSYDSHGWVVRATT
jgi:hypothetical protein